MYSKKSDFSQRRHYSNRDSRSWDKEPRREERREPLRNPTRDPYDKYSLDGHLKTDRLSSREYGESHKRLYSPDGKRDLRRKSPVRKHTSSPDRIVSEKRQRTLLEDDHYRYQQESEETYRQSPEQHSLRNKDFKRTVSIVEGHSRRRTPEDSRYRHEQNEFHYSQYQDEPSYSRSSEYYTDRERSRDRSQERRLLHELIVKDYSPPRQSGSFYRDYEDRNRPRFSLNGSSRQTGESSYRRQSPPPPPPPPPAAAGKKKMSKGFQRFLDVLNMGVNVDTLTRIVTQGTSDVDPRPQSSPSPNAADRSWSGAFTQRREESSRQNTWHWPETERTERPASPQRSSNGNTMSELRTVESSHFKRRFLSQDSESVSPLSLVKSTVSPEEEHKHRQMQDVLQAIGINLEYEELGQMSSRIQERLYGKKQIDSTPNQREEIPRRRAAYYSRHRSRSSSRSSSSCSFQDKKSQSYQRDDWDFSQNDKRGTQQRSNIPLRCEKTEMHTNVKPKLNPPPPPNPTVNCSPNPYTPIPPNLHNIFMPQVPPFLRYPQTPLIPSVNMFPPVVPPSGLPPHLPFSPQQSLPSLPAVYQPQAVNTNTQKTNKNANRPRCLQVISTKNPS